MELDDKTQNFCRQYHRDQEEFEELLSDAPVPGGYKEQFDGLFNWARYTDKKGRSKATPISCDNYPRVFSIVSFIPGWMMPPKMAERLRGAISNREGAQKWYRRLHPADSRRGEDDGHSNIIKVLKDGEALLLKKSALSLRTMRVQ